MTKVDNNRNNRDEIIKYAHGYYLKRNLDNRGVGSAKPSTSNFKCRFVQDNQSLCN